MRFFKYTICLLSIMALLAVMALPSLAAVVTQDISSSQMETILNVDNFSYITGSFSGYNSSFEYSSGTAGDNVPVFYRQNMSGASFGWTADQRNLFDVGFGWLRPSTSLTEASMDLSPNTTYTLSSNLPSASSASGRAGYLYVRNSSGTYQNGVNVVYSGHSVTVTTESDGKLYFGARNSLDGTTSIDWDSFWKQLELGSVATNYMPHDPTVNFNIPLFLSGFKSLILQFIIQGNALDTLDFYKMYSVKDSIATELQYDYIGSLSSSDISYPFHLYQVTLDSDIDILQVQYLPQQVINSTFVLKFGLVAISISADDSVIQGISGQINSINSKITQLISAIGDLQTSFDGLIIQNGDVVTNLTEINDIVNNIEETQEIMTYGTTEQNLTVQQIQQDFSTNETAINNYINILHQYDNKPTVNDVTNIIDNGVPDSQAISDAVAPIQSLFQAEWMIGILATLASVVMLAYVLFGKR